MADFASYLASLPPIALPQTEVSRVQETSELKRIRDAAWCQWDQAADLDLGRQNLTQWLRQPGGTRELKHVQAAVLRALFDNRGCFAPVRTGGGKTDISLVAPTVMQAERALLLVPASVREKTKRNYQALVKQYRLRPLRIFSYESLSLAKSANTKTRWNILLDWRPDLLILDEAHFVKDSGGARWKRIKRYDEWCTEQGIPLVPMLAMSGSFTSRSLREYWHIIRRCLGGAAPVPKDPIEMSAWCMALDEKVPTAARVGPGALLKLAPPDLTDPLEAEDQEPRNIARNRYGRRLCATRGVVASGGDMPPCGLEITIEQVPPTPPMQAAVKHLRDNWETPCGLPFETAMELWRHERELSCGLYYRWKKQPPPEWMVARKAWSVFVRDILDRFHKRYDTPLQVAQAVSDGIFDDEGGPEILNEWRRCEPMFKPDTEPVWICDSTLQLAAAWLTTHKGICWVHHKSFGFELAARTGIPYFHEQGKAENGIAIDMWDGPAIASIRSCSVGFDLQGTAVTKAKHFKNYVVTCPTKNAPNEQMLSRTHRDGQEEDTVYTTYLQRLEGDMKALEQSRLDAEMVERTKRAPQRLTVATWIE